MHVNTYAVCVVHTMYVYIIVSALYSIVRVIWMYINNPLEFRRKRRMPIRIIMRIHTHIRY